MEISLDGKAAIVTGGSKGLGLAMASRFAASGADVAVLARGRDGLDAVEEVIVPLARGRIVAVPCDVSRADDIRRGYEAIAALRNAVYACALDGVTRLSD